MERGTNRRKITFERQTVAREDNRRRRRRSQREMVVISSTLTRM